MAVFLSIIVNALAEALRWRGRELACGAMLLLSASCVPAFADEARKASEPAPALAASAPAAAAQTADTLPPPPLPEPAALENVAPTDALRINASIPMSADPNPVASAAVFAGATPVDRARSLRCLAEAVYYEARSESEDGQRAVAQVVLNRVRSPAYPASVCGVVYQGPLRAGGGCQFTFTCDGSLAYSPIGDGWLRARRIAAEALAGSVYAPVGLSTHYHTQQVLPAWAWKLAKSAVIGSHIFYRMQGAWGRPAAFRQTYRGREPSPATIIATRLPISLGRPSAAALAAPVALSAFAPVQAYPLTAPQGAAALAAPAPAPVNDRLPQSRVKPEFENSGRYLSDALKPSAP